MAKYNVLDGHIINIVQNHEIREQAELQELLKARDQVVPQATLSRHLKRLKIAKVSGVYKIIDYQMPNMPLVLNIQVSETGLIVLQTHPGNANSLAYCIDRKYVSYSPQDPKDSGILATIAGDDTVLVVVHKLSEVDKVLKVFKNDFPYLSV